MTGRNDAKPFLQIFNVPIAFGLCPYTYPDEIDSGGQAG